MNGFSLFLSNFYLDFTQIIEAIHSLNNLLSYRFFYLIYSGEGNLEYLTQMK